MLPSRPRNITLFPYTTLFRSHEHVGLARREHAARRARAPGASLGRPAEPGPARQGHPASRAIPATGGGRAARTGGDRSEEHTSELQSREKLVCRLLLGKKKIC